MTKPITPAEVGKHQATIIPAVVFEVVNTLIASNFMNGSATVKQDSIVDGILIASDITRNEIFQKGYLNFEEAYREAGWEVEYDKPGYNESYSAYFEFTKK